MAEMIVVRHGQASFGTDNYDRLSDLGHQQSKLAGAALRASGWVPDRMITGTLVRQKETLSSMGFDGSQGAALEEHAGLNEYDFDDLLRVRHGGTIPGKVHSDRKTHFRSLRETILEWQAGGLVGAKESWIDFTTRVAAARVFATDTDARRVLVVSSGGPIGQLVASVLKAPEAQMMALNLQVKNTSMTRFMFSSRPDGAVSLNEFNATPHFMTGAAVDMLTYS